MVNKPGRATKKQKPKKKKFVCKKPGLGYPCKVLGYHATACHWKRVKNESS